MKRCVFCLMLAVLVFAGLLAAQDNRGTIQGSVKDPQGGVVANATVMIQNVDTGVAVSLKSNENGRYQAPLLLPGNYLVSAEATGFKKELRTGIVLQVTDVRDVDITLQLGASTESVTVTSEAPLVDVSRTDAGRVIDDRSVQDLPVMANTVFTMIRYSAGVQSGGPPILLGPHSTQGGSDYNNGTGFGGNHWTIDGAINDGNARYTANLPSVESVSETKVLTTTFEGSFGHSIGLGISVSTKSGTNQFHGSGSENYWSQRWQASNLFTKQAYYKTIDADYAAGNTTKALSDSAKPIQPSGHSNLFTLNGTGPLYIPHVVNMRDKIFWTFNYDGERDAKPEDNSTFPHIVPTAAERSGNFSDLTSIAANAAQYQLYDPLSVQVDPSRAGHYVRTPLAGNVLPASYIAQGANVYKNYVKYWPDPNNWFDHTLAPTTNDYLSSDTPYNWIYNQFSGRMDANVTSKMRMFGRYTQNHFLEYRGDWTHDIVAGWNNQNAAGSGVWRDDQNGILDWIYTATPATILHAAFSVSNWSSQATVLPYPFSFKPSDMGFPTYMDTRCAQLSSCMAPYVSVTGYSQNGVNGYPVPIYNRFWTYAGDVYHNVGNHQFRAGVDIRNQVRSIHGSNNAGSITYNNTYFRQCDDGCANGAYSPGGIGLSWASFMMGLPTGISMSDNDSSIVANPFYAGFIQDTWRVNNKLTLTLSLRSEFEMGPKERYNRWISGYDPSLSLPISAAAQTAFAANDASVVPEIAASQFKLLGGTLYNGTAGAPARAWNSQVMWLPRLGFGYQLSPTTIIRGGYGIYYDTLDVNATSYGPNQTGYSLSTNPSITNNQGISWLVGNPAAGVSAESDPFPVQTTGARFTSPLGNALGNMALFGTGWTFPAERHPKQQRWRIGIERQFGAQNVLSVFYEGTYTNNLNVNVSASSIPSTYYNQTANYKPTGICTMATGTQTGCLWDSTLSAVVPNPVNIGNFASLASSNPTLYNYMATQGTYTATTTAISNLIRQYPLANVTYPDAIGKGRSQQLDVSFNHRFNHGLTANLAYTRMTTWSATGFYQPWNGFDTTNPQQLYWAPNGGIPPNRIGATWVYDLPFGKGRQFIQNSVLSQIVGGWALSGTYDYAPGGLTSFPSSTFYYGNSAQIGISDPTLGQQFNTAGCVSTATAITNPADTVVAVGTPCTQGFDKRSGQTQGTYQARQFPAWVNGLRGPSYQQTNASLSRNFKIYERFTFQFRVDALNVFNHSFLGGVNTTPSSNQFGQITAAASNLNRFIQIQGHLRW